MRHATDPDHVIAVTTIVSRQRSVRRGRVDGGALGARAHADDPGRWEARSSCSASSFRPGWGSDGVLRRDHAGPAGGPDADRRPPSDPGGARGTPTPEATWIATSTRTSTATTSTPTSTATRRRRTGTPRSDAPGAARPHARAIRRVPDPAPAGRRAGPRARGSAAVSLLVLTTIRDLWWAVGYLLVFGVGTIVGMMLSRRDRRAVRGDRPPVRAGSTATSPTVQGVLSLAFGLWMAYQIGVVDEVVQRRSITGVAPDTASPEAPGTRAAALHALTVRCRVARATSRRYGSSSCDTSDASVP